MTLAAAARTGTRRRLARAVAALIVTQIVGWGTTFHVPAVLSARVAAGTGIKTEFVFGGLTLMLIVSAFVAPRAGRLMAKDGARRWAMVGSVLVALGLGLLSTAHGLPVFILSWIVFGLAMPLALNQAASTALVQISPGRARSAIAVLLLVSGFSSTIAWPALIALDNWLGWRGAVGVCAGLNLLVCLPLHALGLPRGLVIPDDEGGAETTTRSAPPVSVPGAFWLSAVAFSLSGMLTWGLPLHMIGILKDYGHAEAAAVSIAALLGPGQVAARGFEMAGGHRLGIMTVGVGAMAMMPVALAAMLLWGSSDAGALAFSLGYGLSAGLISIVRAVVPLRLFGAAAYATVLGRLNVPQNMAFAAAPLGFAVMREHLGSPALVVLAVAISAVCLGAMVELARRTRIAQATAPA